ncbi:MAG TPA: class I SAM-dependent methyltransferase [Candidatus Limnocylindria bacterium]
MSVIPSSEDALAAWALRVRANRDQAERVREGAEGSDFYAPVAQVFRVPRRTDEPALHHLLSLALAGERWLDIGAGGGRYALPLAMRVSEVIALDPSPAMLDQLRAGMAEHGIENVRVVASRWPMLDAPTADVALIAHVGYDIEDIGPFLDAMEASARRLCVAIMLAESPAAAAAPFFQQIHDEPRDLLPALPEFLALLLARGRLFEVWLGERGPSAHQDRDMVLAFLRQQLFLGPHSEKDTRLQALVASLPEVDGGLAIGSASVPLGVVSWTP